MDFKITEHITVKNSKSPIVEEDFYEVLNQENQEIDAGIQKIREETHKTTVLSNQNSDKLAQQIK